MMRIKKENLLHISAFFVISLIGTGSSYFFVSENVTSELSWLGIVCAVELAAFLWCNSKINRTMLNYSTFFTLVLFVFHFGQLMIYTFFRNLYSHVRILRLLEVNDVFFGFRAMNASFVCICLGMMISSVKNEYQRVPKKEMVITEYYDWEKIAKRIILWTFPIKVILDVITLWITFTQGGLVAREWVNTFPNVFLYYGKIALVGFGLLIVCLKEQPIKQRNVFFFIEVYILAMMMSGIRSENVGYVLVFFFLYIANVKKKIRFWVWGLCGILGIFGLTFIVATGEFRLLEDRSLASFATLFMNIFTKRNVIFHLLDTLGDTGYTAQCVINKWLPLYGPSYGTSYLLGSFAIIPNIPGVFDLPGNLTELSCFPVRLQEAGTLAAGYLNIGGSLLGEIFFNFGIQGGLVCSVIMGILIGTVNTKSLSCFKNADYYGMIKMIPIMFACVYWVRNYFGGGIREAVWGPLFCLLVLLCSGKTCRRKTE